MFYQSMYQCFCLIIDFKNNELPSFFLLLSEVRRKEKVKTIVESFIVWFRIIIFWSSYNFSYISESSYNYLVLWIDNNLVVVTHRIFKSYFKRKGGQKGPFQFCCFNLIIHTVLTNVYQSRTRYFSSNTIWPSPRKCPRSLSSMSTWFNFLMRWSCLPSLPQQLLHQNLWQFEFLRSMKTKLDSPSVFSRIRIRNYRDNSGI